VELLSSVVQLSRAGDEREDRHAKLMNNDTQKLTQVVATVLSSPTAACSGEINLTRRRNFHDIGCVNKISLRTEPSQRQGHCFDFDTMSTVIEATVLPLETGEKPSLSSS
jgi:hypothetical protein